MLPACINRCRVADWWSIWNSCIFVCLVQGLFGWWLNLPHHTLIDLVRASGTKHPVFFYWFFFTDQFSICVCFSGCMKKNLNEQCSCAVSNCLESMSMISVLMEKKRFLSAIFMELSCKKTKFSKWQRQSAGLNRKKPVFQQNVTFVCGR